MIEYFTVGTTHEIPDGESRCFEIQDRAVAVFNNAGTYTAIDDMCPHMGASLSEGHFDKETCTVVCPWHGWRFDVNDGGWKDNPQIKIDAFAVQIVDDQIQIGIKTPSPGASDDSGDNP